MSEPEPVPLPNERTASPAAWQPGCTIACALALLPVLYVGSFVYLVADGRNRWGVIQSLDESTLDTLTAVYAPLIWFWEQTAKLAGFDYL